MDVPHRIVSLVPSHTETLHGLGLGDRVVGRTRFCIHPSTWVGGVPSVDGTKDAKLEKIVELKPDLVVADKDENPKALIDALEAAGIDVLWSEIPSVPAAAEFVEELAQRCGVPEAGRFAAQATLRTLLEVRKEWEKPQGGGPSADATVPIFCPIWHNPWMTFDHTSYPHAMLEAVGLRNVFGDHKGTRYFEVSENQVREAQPAWTLLPTEPFPFHKQRERLDLTGLGKAGEPRRVRIIDGEALTWFGLRTATGLRELARVSAELRRAA